jgi:hypothetical protein
VGLYVASLGNDPAPIMVGFLLSRFLQQNTVWDVRLVSEQSERELIEARRKRLEDWLMAQGARSVIWIKATSLENSARAATEALATSDPLVFVNVTGGTKLLSLELWNAASLVVKANVFSLNVHGNGNALLLSPVQKSLEVFPRLTIEDYLSVYKPDHANLQPLTTEETALLKKFHQKDDFVALEYRTQRFAVRMNKDRLELFYLKEIAATGNRQDFMIPREYASEIGGDAVSVFALIDFQKFDQQRKSNRLEQAKAHRVKVLEVNIVHHTPKAPVASELPFSLTNWTQPNSTTLVVLSSGQMLPALVTLSNHPEITHVVILSTDDKRVEAGRFRSLLEQSKQKVRILTGLSPDQPNRILEATQEVLNELQGQVVINLNGGTTAMMLALWAAICPHLHSGRVQVEYVEDTNVLVLKNKTWERIPDVTITASIQQQIQLNGVRLQPHGLRFDMWLRLNARVAADQNDQASNLHPILEAFQKRFDQLHPHARIRRVQGTSGKAHEYLVWCELIEHLNTPEFEVIPGGHLYDQQWQGNASAGADTDINANICSEVDAIVRYRGKLFLVEVKPSLKKAIEHNLQGREHLNLPIIANRAGGRFARGLLVVKSVLAGSAQNNFQRNLDEALEHNGARHWITLWAREPDAQFPDVRAFPEAVRTFIEQT